MAWLRTLLACLLFPHLSLAQGSVSLSGELGSDRSSATTLGVSLGLGRHWLVSAGGDLIRSSRGVTGYETRAGIEVRPGELFSFGVSFSGGSRGTGGLVTAQVVIPASG